MIIHEILQGTPEWFKVRNLKLTASHAHTIAVAGKGLDTYVNNIVSEYFSDNKEEKYINSNMERGKELEDEARTIYELETGHTVKQVGFIEYSQYVGCSPDGLVNEDGGTEIKNHTANVFTRLICDGEIDKEYYYQIQMNLLITGRKWWDYIGYCQPYRKTIYIKRFEPDLKVFDELKKGFEVGQRKIEERVKKVQEFINTK